MNMSLFSDISGIYTMSPQNHEKWRFWPPKNQDTDHKKPLEM